MKILTVSDSVSENVFDKEFKSKEIRPDLIFSCGDLPPEYLRSLQYHFDAPLLYILGNHDLRYGKSPPGGCQLIDRKMVNVGSVRIVGFSGSRWYNGGMNQFSESEMSSSIRKLRFSFWRKGSPHIVVTHAPPRNIGDAEDPCHKGFKSFSRLIDKYGPRYFIHGHIHKTFSDDAERIIQVNSTRVINSYGFYFFEIDPSQMA